MFKIELKNRDFRKSLYFYIVDAEKKKKKKNELRLGAGIIFFFFFLMGDGLLKVQRMGTSPFHSPKVSAHKRLSAVV